MNGHRSDIKHNRSKPIAEHFNKPNHTLKNLRLAVIKKVKGKTKQQRKVKEQKIIFKVDCVNIKNSYNNLTKLANIDMKIVILVKYLGVTFDKDLSFEFRINNLIIKLSRLVGIPAKTRPFLTNLAMHVLFYILFHNHLIHDLIVWSSNFKSYVNKLSTVQNKAVKIIAGAKWRNRATPYSLKYNIFKLTDLLMFEMATFTYKNKKNLLPLPFQNYFFSSCNIHNQLTWVSIITYNFVLPFCRTKKLQRSIKNQGLKVWNILH